MTPVLRRSLLLPLCALSVGAAPAPAPAPAPTCVARLGQRAHLRPRPDRSADGPELQKGTPLAVLEQVPASKATLRGGRPLYRVQVQPAGSSGYLYLAESDFGAGCPVLFPWTQELTRGEPHKSSAERADCLASSAKTARGLLRGPCVGDPEQDLPIDLDGDGREDRVLLKDGALALLHNTPTGWRPVLLSDSGSVKVRETAAARAGAASYVIDIEGEWERTDDGDEGDPGIDGAINYSIYRVTRGPRTLQVEQVFQATFGVSGEIDKKNLPETYPSIEHCRYSGAPDESLTITCGARVTRLRFDPEKRLLRPAL